MPKIPKIKLAAVYLLKLAEEHSAANPEEQAHEMGETPEHEALEHLHSESEDPMSEYPEQGNLEEISELPGHEQAELPAEEAVEHGEPSEEHEDSEVEHLISQLTPEQLDHLAAQLSEDIQHPDQHEGEDTAALAQAIQEHLSQNPEASLPEASPEKTASLNLIKSAEYIEGFLNEAVYHGATIKEAVDLYDSSLVDALSFVKTSEDKKKENFEGDLASSEAFKEASFLEGFAVEADNSGLTSEEAAVLYKASSSLSNVLRRSGEASEAIHAYRYASKKPGRLKALLDSASGAAKKIKSQAMEKAKDITDRLSKARTRYKQTRIPGVSGESASANVRRAREKSPSFESSRNAPANSRRESPNPFKPNIKGNASKQKTKTTQDYSRVVKEHEKTASTADKLLKMLGRKNFNSLVQAVEDGAKLKGFRPAGMKGDAFTKAIQDVRKNHVSVPTQAGPAPRRAGRGSAAGAKQTPHQKLQAEHQEIQSLLSSNAITEEHAAQLLDEARLKHLKIAPAAPAPPAAPLSQEEVFKAMGARNNPKPTPQPKAAPVIDPAVAARAEAEAAAKAARAEAQAAAKAEADKQRKIFEEVNARTKPTDPETVRNAARKDVETGMSAEERLNATEQAAKARNVNQAEQAAQEARFKAEQDFKNYQAEQAAKAQHANTISEAEQATLKAQQDLARQQKIDAARQSINNNGGVDAQGRIKGVTRQQQNEIVTDLHGGQAPDYTATFEQALAGSTDPRMRGVRHNLAARMGRAGKVMADNPLATGAALGAGTLGVMSGASSSPQELPARYRQPVRPSRPQPPQQFS